MYKFTSKDATTIDLGSEKNEDVKFIKVLGTLQRQMLINAEKRNREVFGFKKLQDEFFKELQEIIRTFCFHIYHDISLYFLSNNQLLNLAKTIH